MTRYRERDASDDEERVCADDERVARAVRRGDDATRDARARERASARARRRWKRWMDEVAMDEDANVNAKYGLTRVIRVFVRV